MMGASYLKLFFFLVAVVDPFGSIPVYLEATKRLSVKQKNHVALRAPVYAFFILLFFILLGQLILDVMDVSLVAFQVSGGVILFLFSLTMIFGKGKPEAEKSLIESENDVSIFPVAIPSIASPGAILAVVMVTDNDVYSIPEQAITVLLVLFTLLLTFLALKGAQKLQDKIGEGGIVIISKVMGLIISSFAVQSILIGLKEFFNIQ